MRIASGIFSALLLRSAAAQSYVGPEDPRLVTQLTLNTSSTGVSTTPGGRLFLVLPRVDGTNGPSIVEYFQDTNTSKAYPNEEWNSYAPGKDPATHFVTINAQRIGPDGNMYLVDTGMASLETPVIMPGGPKLIQVNLTTNAVQRVYPMDNGTRSDSLLDDVRFHPATGLAYLTDAGASSFVVLDLASGDTRRVLDNALSTRQYMPVSAEGHIVTGPNGLPFHFYNDQVEVSPNGKYVYFQPACGGLSRVEAKYLDSAFYNSSMNANSVLEPLVEPFAHTPSTGGTAIDCEGNVYCSDTDSQRIIKIFPNGTMVTLVQDPRLLWVDAMWIDTKGRLWMPAAQLNRGEPFNNGTSKIVKPLYVYTIDLGIGPSLIDHA